MAALVNSRLMAQVYSLPVVGYLNITIPQGYSLLAVPLLEEDQTNGAVNAVADIFQAFPPAVFPQTTNGPQNGFTVFTMDGSGFKANNYLNGWTDPEMSLLPGTAWFFKNPYDFQYPGVTIVGSIPDGTNQLPTGFSACGSIVPWAGGLTSDLLFPATNGDQVFTFNGTNNTYSISLPSHRNSRKNGWKFDENLPHGRS